ncbi:PDGLE domain-containing protein [Methanococcoides methylutens]|uniref:PDGLE domain-containing protein n=1 Tax=Methanococcoides methylutens TaxID=2226 RepID=UPI0040443D10
MWTARSQKVQRRQYCDKPEHKLLYAGIAIALLISVLAPFLASPDPDGLESAAESVIDEERFAELEEAEPAIEIPNARLFDRRSRQSLVRSLLFP